MKRRELIKGLGALTALSFIPGIVATEVLFKKKFHFVGLGTGGTNVVYRVKEIGIAGHYSCVTWFPSFVEPYKGLNHTYYEYPREFRQSTDIGRKSIPLTDEIKSLLSGDEIYIVFVGLGSFTGSSLIRNVVEFFDARNTNYLAICSLPFKAEGKWRNEYAAMRKNELSKYEKVRFFDINPIKSKSQVDSISRMLKLADEEMIGIFKNEIYRIMS